MSRLRTLGVLLSAALAATLLYSPPAAGVTIPDAEVRINAQAFEGPRGTILASLRARCAPGFEVADLIVEFSQGDVSTPPSLVSPFPCDGQWRRLDVSSDEAFQTGPATMTARLSVTDVETGDPGDQAFQSKQIFVRPAARIFLPKYGVLTSPDHVKVVLRARCDPPWLAENGFLAFASQGPVGDMAVATRSLPDITCDGLYHSVSTTLTSDSTTPFRRGWMRLEASLSLLDPEQFDPVTQVDVARRVWVR